MNSTTSGGPSTTSGRSVPNTGPSIVVAAFTTWSIAVVFVLLRLYTRAFIIRAVGPADYCITAAVIFAGGLSGAILKQTKHGMGLHVADIDVFKEFPIMLYAWWWSLICYTTTLAFSKISICLLYLTIFTLEWARRACYVVLSIVIASNLWALVSVFTYTVPLAATWDNKVVATYSTSQEVWWAITGFAVGTDVLIFILPIPIVAPLKLPRRQKLAVVGIFAVGVFTVFVAFIRLVILIQEKGVPDPDFTWNGTNLTYWTVIEVNTAIVVACIMTLKPLVGRVFPGLLDSRPRGSMIDPSIISSGPPLTIGSKPSRNPLSPVNRESWIEISGPSGDGDVMLRDIETGVEDTNDQPRQPAVAHIFSRDEKGVLIRVEIRSAEDSQRGDVSSHRSQESQAVATARTIG